MRQAGKTRRDRRTLKDKKREETRRKLIEAAKRLFSEFGYDDVPVTEIAQEAGVTHSMINVYFGGKPGLLYEIVRQNNAPQYEASKRIAESDAPALDRLSDMLRLWLEEDARDPRLLAIMQSYSWVWPPETEQENAEDRGCFLQFIVHLIRAAQETGRVRSDLDAEVAATSVFAIYTWGLRNVVFGISTHDECHVKIMDQIDGIVR